MNKGLYPKLNASPFQTAAATILTVEARHNAYVRLVNGESPFPTAFDTPVDPRAIVTLATPFFTGCPNGSAPAFQGFPALNVTGKLTAGSSITVASTNTTGATNCAFLSGLNTTFSTFADGKCQVPTDGKVGGGQVSNHAVTYEDIWQVTNISNTFSLLLSQVYVLLTSAQNVTDSSTIAGPAIVEMDTAGATNFTRVSSTDQMIEQVFKSNKILPIELCQHQRQLGHQRSLRRHRWRFRHLGFSHGWITLSLGLGLND
jgi:hypothetical protein